MTFFDYIDKHPVWTLVFLVVACCAIEGVASSIATAFVNRRRP